MSDITPIEKTRRSTSLMRSYSDLSSAIHDAKSVANLLTAIDSDECDVNAAGYAQERILERAEDIFKQLWKFLPSR